MKRELKALLERLLLTHSPSGDEREMNERCLAELDGLCSRVWQDEAGNVIGLIKGRKKGSPLRLMAHKDEIGCMVARIDEEGRMRLEPLGGAIAWVYGEGPLDVLGDEVITGVFGIGSKHVSDLSSDVHAAKTSRPLSWDVCRLDCKLDREELAEKGITVGTRVCVSRSRKRPLFMGDYVAGYGLDDKVAVAALIVAARLLKRARRKPAQDTYLCMTSAEETGVAGAAYCARTLPGDTVIAAEVAPVAPEYPIEPGSSPVVLYKDGSFIYDKQLADALCGLSSKLGFESQKLAVRGYGSDASYVAKYGLAGKVAGVAVPTENTHGCEITHLQAILNCAELLANHAAGTTPKPRKTRAKKGARKRA